MGSRTWALTGALILAAAALGAWSTTNVRAWSEALDRHDVADDLHAVGSARLERLDARLTDAGRTLTETQASVTGQRQNFTPGVLAAVSGVQASAVDAACGQARTATREATALPAAQPVLDLAVAASTAPVLADLDGRWATFLRPAQVQAEIDTCAADEAALIEAERQAELAAQRSSNCGAPLFPEDSCPTDAELAAEQQAESICGPGTSPGHPWYDYCQGLGPPP